MSGECKQCGEHALECKCVGWIYKENEQTTPIQETEFRLAKHLRKVLHLDCEDRMSQWISVKDRLPEPYDFVLVFADNKGINEPKPMSIARIEINNENWEFVNRSPLMPNYGVYMDIEHDMDSDDVTHWMPLPEPPKEEQ